MTYITKVIAILLVTACSFACGGMDPEGMAPVDQAELSLEADDANEAAVSNVLQPIDRSEDASLDSTCGTFHAPTPAQCTFIRCEAIGCGAPGHWDPNFCQCHCSYMF